MLLKIGVWLWELLPGAFAQRWPSEMYDWLVFVKYWPNGSRTVYFSIRIPKPNVATKLKQQGIARKAGIMNIGDKVIAVGMGRKTKELNNGDLKRNGNRSPGFTGLVVDMVVMTVKEIDGDTIRTPFYTFHKDDLHLVDTGRASAPLR